ncbi:MAG: hypothetical protein HY912_09330, partial [Desulfomonile tiedjei]|nr:hypothetical protein [Desulfomonile tiedjei]
MSSRTSVKEQTGSGISWGKTILAAIVAACLAWLVAGVTLHLGSVEPAQRLSISEQAKSLAKELDAALKIRAAVVMSVVYNRSLEKLLASTGLDNFANFIHGQLSDFLSLEMLNDNGEVVAMIGELPLSQADLSSKDAGENVFRKDPRAFVTGIFRDDPVNGCFFLTCRHRNGDGTYWYTRTRFTRRVIEGLLNEFQGRASLVSISGGKHDLEVVYGHPTRTYGSSWSGLQSVEATLESPGWLVKVAAEDNVSPFRRKSIILPAIALVFTIIACFLWPRIRISEPWKKDSQGSGATEIPAGRESGRSFDTTKESAGTKNRAKPELSGRIEAPGLPRQNELFAAYFADDYRPGENQATSKRDESYEDYFCPSQLI